jgi:general secretion pathway protein G
LRIKAFTLVELLIVVVVIAVIAAIAYPKFGNASQVSFESAAKAEIKVLRNASTQFQADTGAWPASLDDLTAASAPASGLDSNGNTIPIVQGWNGPYVMAVPDQFDDYIAYTDAGSGTGGQNSPGMPDGLPPDHGHNYFGHFRRHGTNTVVQVTPPPNYASIGSIFCPQTGNDVNGIPYTYW